MHALTFLLALSISLSSAFASSDSQIPLRNMPELMSETDAFSGPLMLSDILTLQNSASIFFSYARETKLSKAFSAANERSTVLAPTNKAVMALARKP